MTGSEPSSVRRIIAFGTCLVGAGMFLWALTDMSVLAGSAKAFRLHHEVTTPLCVMLAKFIAAIAAGGLALGLLGRFQEVGRNLRLDIAACCFLILLCLVTGVVLENEKFFTLYDNKSLPVHPTEIVMHPKSGWMTAGAHMGICLAGLVGAGLYLLVTARRKINGADRKLRNEGSND